MRVIKKQNKMRKTIGVLVFVISILIIFFLISLFIINSGFTNIGGANYFFMPFPVKVTSCGTFEEAYKNCEYPWLPWGILLSVLFWILVIFLAYKIGMKIFK